MLCVSMHLGYSGVREEQFSKLDCISVFTSEDYLSNELTNVSLFRKKKKEGGDVFF